MYIFRPPTFQRQILMTPEQLKPRILKPRTRWAAVDVLVKPPRAHPTV